MRVYRYARKKNHFLFLFFSTAHKSEGNLLNTKMFILTTVSASFPIVRRSATVEREVASLLSSGRQLQARVPRDEGYRLMGRIPFRWSHLSP